MMNKRIFVLAAVLLFWLGEASEADAQRRRRGGSNYAERHLTMPKRTLRIDVGPFERSLSDSGTINGPFSHNGYGLRLEEIDHGANDDLYVTLGTGLSYGINDRVEIGGQFLPAILSDENDDADFGDMTTYVRWAFVDNRVFQMGLHGVVQFPTRTDFGLGVGLPMNINAGDVVRIETGAELEVLFDARDRDGDGNEEAILSVDVPIAITGRIARRGFLGGRADLLFFDLGGDDHANDLRPAVGATGGASIFGRRATIADFTGQMLFFVGDAIDWELTFGASISIGL
jgi:hypothetical protein